LSFVSLSCQDNNSSTIINHKHQVETFDQTISTIFKLINGIYFMFSTKKTFLQNLIDDNSIGGLCEKYITENVNSPSLARSW